MASELYRAFPFFSKRVTLESAAKGVVYSLPTPFIPRGGLLRPELSRPFAVGKREGADLFGLSRPELLQFANLVGQGEGEVGRFAAVFAKIVEFPLSALLRGTDQFPVADAEARGCPRGATKNSRVSRRRPWRTMARGFCRGAAGPAAVATSVAMVPPVSSRMVGGRFGNVAGIVAEFAAAAMPSGQWRISGVEMPPSWTHVLWRRKRRVRGAGPTGAEQEEAGGGTGRGGGSLPSPRTMISRWRRCRRGKR